MNSLSAQIDFSVPDTSTSSTGSAYVGFGISLPLSAQLLVGGLNDKGWGQTLSLNWRGRSAKNQPRDFDGGRGLLGEGSDQVKDDQLIFFSLRALKEFKMGTERSFLSIEAGPSVVFSAVADNFTPVLNPCTRDTFFGYTSCSRNYNYKRDKKNALGLSLRSSVGMGFEGSDFAGFEIGLQANWNRNWPYYGIDAMLIFGNRFDRKKPD